MSKLFVVVVFHGDEDVCKCTWKQRTYLHRMLLLSQQDWEKNLPQPVYERDSFSVLEPSASIFLSSIDFIGQGKKTTKNGELKFAEVFCSVWLSINVCREKLTIPRLRRQSSPILHPWLQWHSEGQSNCHKPEPCLCKEVQGVVVSVTTLCIDQCAVVYTIRMTLLLYKYCTLYNCCLSNVVLVAPTVKGM